MTAMDDLKSGLNSLFEFKTIERIFKNPAFYIFVFSVLLSIFIGQNVAPNWSIEKVTLDVKTMESGEIYYTYKNKPKVIDTIVPLSETQLTKENLSNLQLSAQEIPEEEYVFETVSTTTGEETRYYQLKSQRHWGIWSLLPALVAIMLCWMTKEPITALFSGVIVGAFLLGKYDLSDQVFLEVFMSKNAAGILLLYLWLLGGLMGVWSRTGAAQAFAQLMTKHVVRGPRTAKLVAWALGIIFFQGGTMSTVLVGTTVKPIADKERISHEELAYIVDSTASPIACLIAFNAWPAYIQAFLVVSGAPFLLTEADRLSFFFKSVPLSFYSIFAVLGTFLLSIDKAPFLGKRFNDAIKRARDTGQLDHPDAKPLSAKELHTSHVPANYTPHVLDFFIPLGMLIGTTIFTFVSTGSPNVRWAFGFALLSGCLMALFRGMHITQLMEGIGEGLKGVVMGSVILILAITIGLISSEVGGGIYLVELLGNGLPYWILPSLLLILTMTIAFSTGTSWGTYAVAFPLAMPLAWAVAHAQGLEYVEFYMMVCFATVLNGSVVGDQCSPISDTTILSAMVTGCDLMDHVKTQIIPATAAAILAGICWTLAVLFFAGA